MSKVLAITSCPTGVAHTYMAAENLEKAAEKLGVDIKVETHGSVGIENKFTSQEIQEAEGLIIAADTNIEKSRFAAKAPLRVIPSIVIGSSVGAVIAALTGVTDHVAHGGPIVAVLGAVDNVFMFFVAVLVGTLVAALLIGLLMPKPEAQLATAKAGASYSQERQESAQDNGTIEANDEHHQMSEESTRTDMTLTELTAHDLIVMDLAEDKKETALRKLVNLPALESVISDQDAVLSALVDRESQGSTGFGDGVAIPHAKSSAISEARVVFARSKNGVDWQSLDDQPVRMLFMILVPDHQKGDLHLKILQMLARKLTHDDFKAELMAANSKEEVYNILSTVK